MSEASSPIGVAAFGVSTPSAYRGFHLVRLLVEAIAGPSTALHIASMAQLREGFQRRGGASVVVTSDLPDAELANFICASSLPLIVFADEPGVFLDWMMQSRALVAEDAARLCSRVYASQAASRIARRTLFLDLAALSPERAVSAIVDFLWPGRERAFAAQAFEALVAGGKIERDRIGGERVESSGAPASLKEAVLSYAPLAQGRPLEAIVWPLALFTRADGRPWSDPLQLTGPARVLFWGPYMHLPAGDWIARVEFEIAGAVSGVEALTDVRVNEVVAEKSFTMPAKGIFAYEIAFRVGDPHHAAEIRMFTRKSAIEGVFLPRSVRVRPSNERR